MIYHKLVRDKIPERIAGKGEPFSSHVADEAEYWVKLKEKLVEEAQEFRENESIGELADLLEVIDAVIEYRKFDRSELEAVKRKKFDERGGFAKRIILEES